ncbi:MAG: EamA family transporter RarD [Burkholderiaceae bacterium]|nr:MAG: EamA family transporter RarD [Burkholderiaceae bacterium]
MNKGLLYALAVYLVWGLFPLFFHLFNAVAPIEVMLNRILWSGVFVALIWLRRNEWRWLRDAVTQPKVLWTFIGSAVCIALNWFVYIYAVHTHRVVDASLGYFINPLVSVLLGFVFLRERMRSVQWLAIVLATTGVVWMIVQRGEWPWIALVLAVSFGAYGLLRKIASLNALKGLTLETFLLCPLALIWLGRLMAHQQSTLLHGPLSMQLLLIAAGPVTAVPLMFFASAARRISLTTLGVLQYIVPTMQLLIGLWVLDEPFGSGRAAGFVLIWLALILYATEALWQYRRETRPWGNLR